MPHLAEFDSACGINHVPADFSEAPPPRHLRAALSEYTARTIP
jgi:hypothetical protein